MSKINLQSRYAPYYLDFEFSNQATMNAAETVEVYLNGDPNQSWYPINEAVYSGNISCMVTCIDPGSGSQLRGATQVDERNIIFEYVSGTSVITHNHTYFKHSDTNMNGTWTFAVNPTNQGIKTTWKAPSGANTTTFKMRCIAHVNEILL